MEKGLSLFLSLEGVDGTGKTTLIERLREYLESRGHKIVVTKEPGRSNRGELIRGMLFSETNPGPGTKNMFPGQADCLLLYDHIGHVEEVIVPALAAGKTVITDRYVDSQFAYTAARPNMKAINDAFAYYYGPVPDVTFLLIGDVATFFARAKGRDAKADAAEPGKQASKAWNDLEKQKRIQEAYIHNLANQPRTIIIDITHMDTQAVANAAIARLEGWLEGHRVIPEQVALFSGSRVR